QELPETFWEDYLFSTRKQQQDLAFSDILEAKMKGQYQEETLGAAQKVTAMLSSGGLKAIQTTLRELESALELPQAVNRMYILEIPLLFAMVA
ncbi:unnamed protein product, partial [Amoebophrya sp. A25]